MDRKREMRPFGPHHAQSQLSPRLLLPLPRGTVCPEDMPSPGGQRAQSGTDWTGDRVEGEEVLGNICE